MKMVQLEDGPYGGIRAEWGHAWAYSFMRVCEDDQQLDEFLIAPGVYAPGELYVLASDSADLCVYRHYSVSSGLYEAGRGVWRDA